MHYTESTADSLHLGHLVAILTADWSVVIKPTLKDTERIVSKQKLAQNVRSIQDVSFLDFENGDNKAEMVIITRLAWKALAFY